MEGTCAGEDGDISIAVGGGTTELDLAGDGPVVGIFGFADEWLLMTVSFEAAYFFLLSSG